MSAFQGFRPRRRSRRMVRGDGGAVRGMAVEAAGGGRAKVESCVGSDVYSDPPSRVSPSRAHRSESPADRVDRPSGGLQRRVNSLLKPAHHVDAVLAVCLRGGGHVFCASRSRSRRSGGCPPRRREIPGSGADTLRRLPRFRGPRWRRRSSWRVPSDAVTPSPAAFSILLTAVASALSGSINGDLDQVEAGFGGLVDGQPQTGVVERAGLHRRVASDLHVVSYA
jgi:hypothetical protein